MGTYVGFLRAINLGANRRFPKGDIVRVVESVGFTGVATHIASGNVRFETPMRSRARIEAMLEAAFLADRGFEVPTIVFTPAELAEIVRVGGELAAERPGSARHYVYLMKEEVDAATRAAVEATASEHGEMIVHGRAAHALLGPAYQAGDVDPLRAAKLLGVATNRNLGVVTTIVQKWG